MQSGEKHYYNPFSKPMKTYYELIFYVADQERSRHFYAAVLNKEPDLHVPGMTEFTLNENLKLGLMPEDGISKILAGKTPHPSDGNGIPRCELYIHSDDINELFTRAIKAGATEVDAIRSRDWGDSVGYVMDPDGHILAFAKRNETH